MKKGSQYNILLFIMGILFLFNFATMDKQITGLQYKQISESLNFLKQTAAVHNFKHKSDKLSVESDLLKFKNYTEKFKKERIDKSRAFGFTITIISYITGFLCLIAFVASSFNLKWQRESLIGCLAGNSLWFILLAFFMIDFARIWNSVALMNLKLQFMLEIKTGDYQELVSSMTYKLSGAFILMWIVITVLYISVPFALLKLKPKKAE